MSTYVSLHLHCASGFHTQILAHMLDSLVRVSRRVDENHFVSFANPATTKLLSAGSTCRTNRTLFSYALERTGTRMAQSGLSVPLSSPKYAIEVAPPKQNPHPTVSPASQTEADQHTCTTTELSNGNLTDKEQDAPASTQRKYTRCKKHWFPALPS